jgi:hypothetical protein
MPSPEQVEAAMHGAGEAANRHLESARAEGARQERKRLVALLGEHVEHTSWRCEHPPHYYLAEPPENDCACGLTSALREAGLEWAAVLSEGDTDA